ncbi:MAG: HAD-IA family hydrolase [Planctomycetes bacterium]|nr:HAD-IA family hydrolase [Planctomycetota bacterium]
MNDTTFIFDIGRVLLNFSFLPLQERMAANADCTVAHIDDQFFNKTHIDVEIGKIDVDTYFDQFCEATGLTWTREEWITQWGSIFEPNTFGQGLFKTLREQGHSVALLSNLGPHHTECIKQRFTGFFDTFAPYYFSYELGFHKPDPNIYHATCKGLSKPPEKCLFIDDMKENVFGAQGIGMHSIQMTPENHDDVERFVRSFL